MAAESIISDVLSKMLTTLGSNAYKKIMIARSLDSHIQKLQDLKTTVQATLLDADLLESCTHAQHLQKIVSGLMDCANTCKIGDLTQDDSWLLFKRIAFTGLQEQGVEAIGKQIARMCHKVPLVIWSIAGHLAEKRTVREWQAFRDDQLAHFTSYGRDIMQTLKLSYDHLDEKLK